MQARKKKDNAELAIGELREEEKAAELEKLQKRIDAADYEKWLDARNLSAFEKTGDLDEKILFINEYISEANNRGHAIDVHASFLLDL